ncbi:hypothetical protein AgCh_030961 [Apium graveolens]
MLYWGEIEKEEKCITCGLSRWVVVEKSNTNDDEAQKIPLKVPCKNIVEENIIPDIDFEEGAEEGGEEGDEHAPCPDTVEGDFVELRQVVPQFFSFYPVRSFWYKNKAVVEPDIEPCDAEKKRQLSVDLVMQRKTLTKKLSSGDAVWDELGTIHNPNWLKGRCVRPNMQNNVQIGTYIKELTAKIKEGLASELEDKVKKVEFEFQEKEKKVEEGVELKVRQNMEVVLKRLAKANPDIRIDIQDLCVIAASGNDDGTPITGRNSL